jgi:rubredoxin
MQVRPVKQQKAARRAKPVTGTASSTPRKPMPIETARTVVSLVARQFVSREIEERAARNHVCDYGVMSASQLEEYFESEVQRFGGRKPAVDPIPMRLPCPCCGALHIDEDEFAAKPHHTHSCQTCGLTWRPAVPPTVGVRFLPGFRNAAPEKMKVQP